MNGSDVPETVGSGSKRAIEILERRIDRTEAQLEGLRMIRSAVIWKSIPFMGVVLALAFGILGWDLSDPIAFGVSVVLIGGLVLFGVGAQLGIRRGERRLEEIEAEYAAAVGTATSGPAGRGEA